MKLFILGISLALPVMAWGQTPISGSLTGTLNPDTYIVMGDCDVPSGQTLTILPGANILFSGYYSISVYGRLIAEGTVTDSIFFRRQYPTEECKHGGIRFQEGASDSNSLAYCHIDYADNPTFPECYGGAVLCMNAGVQIAHCTITNCRALYGGGIYVIDSQVSVSECSISHCTALARGGGLYTKNSTTEVSFCDITHNTGDQVGGIVLYDNDAGEIHHNLIAFNTATTYAS
jgi:hypothetical protein